MNKYKYIALIILLIGVIIADPLDLGINTILKNNHTSFLNDTIAGASVDTSWSAVYTLTKGMSGVTNIRVKIQSLGSNDSCYGQVVLQEGYTNDTWEFITLLGTLQKGTNTNCDTALNVSLFPLWFNRIGILCPAGADDSIKIGAEVQWTNMPD